MFLCFSRFNFWPIHMLLKLPYAEPSGCCVALTMKLQATLFVHIVTIAVCLSWLCMPISFCAFGKVSGLK